VVRPLRVRSVDERGIVVSSRGDRAVDVLFDGQRVWSFWVRRDTEPHRAGRRLAPWPVGLKRFLDGRTRVVVREPGSPGSFFDRETSFGDGDERIRVVNARGVQLGMDKSGKMVPTFETRGRGDIAALVAATRSVLDALATAGVQPFLGYGTLLGAVREGAVLGHDSDADVCYLSDHKDPIDVARESFRLQRELDRLGFETSRYSGAAFRVQVTEGDGVVRGLDVFGGFLSGGRLYLMGEIGVEFEREWIHPLTTRLLEGVEMPVPAQPERLLEATYGPGWRFPDPAFQFSTPARTTRAFNDWFRGLGPNARLWQRRYARRGHHVPGRGPSQAARRVAREARSLGAQVLDVGAGKGGDSLWLARRGHQVTAYDYTAKSGLAAVAAVAQEEGVALDARRLNLTEWRSVFGEGARLAHSPVPRVVLARHVLDATDTEGRRGFARWCAMALRAGGTMVAEFHVGEGGDDLEWTISTVDPQQMVQWLTAGGAKSVTVTQLEGKKRPTVRLVGEW
jgi:Tellurite resistance protein TehB